MKYVSVDVILEELAKLGDYVSIFDSECFRQAMHALKESKEVGFDLPDCNDCKYALKDYKGYVRNCANDHKQKQILEKPNLPMAVCGYYEGVSG